MSQFSTSVPWYTADVVFADGAARTHDYHTMVVPTGGRIIELIGDTTLIVCTANVQSLELKEAP